MNLSLHLWVCIALLSAGTLSAQVLTNTNVDYQLKPERAIAIPNLQANTPFLSVKEDLPSVQALTYKFQFWSTFGAYFEYFNDQSAFIYEPRTDKVFLLKPEPISDPTSGNITGGKLILMMSGNRGVNFSPGTEIASRAGTVFLLPSLSVSNPGNQITDPSQLNWFAYASKYVFDASTQNFNRSGQLAIYPSSGTPLQFDMDDVEGAPGSFLWTTGDLTGYSGDNSTAYMAGVLDPTNSSSQYGTYGTWSFDYLSESFPISTTPSAWDNSQFAAAPSTTQTFNAKPQIGVDSEGRVYVVVNNIFADDPNVRAPAVSISENQGVDWTAFDRMPVSAYNAYRSQYGWDNINVYGPYHLDALATTGVGKFSYFFRVYQTDPSDQNIILNIDLVEASFDNGVWTLSRVAELKGTTPPVFQRGQNSPNNVWLSEYLVNPQGNEIDASITANGQNILLKWIDINPARVAQFTPPLTVYFNQSGSYATFELDSLAATDVYVSYRSLSSSNWSTPVNISDDDNYDHGTKIPGIIPDLENVPFLTNKTILKSEVNSQYQWYSVIQSMPNLFLSANVDVRTPNGINTTVLDVLNVNSVEPDDINAEFRISDIKPNPTSESAEVSFSMDKPGNVSIDVLSVTGTTVKKVYNGFLSSGPHFMNVQTADLASGSYYVVLNVDGAQTAHQLSVLK
ncbi:MAG: hypothetical protein HYX66_07580 [Ignavibacteria bacterium]|nr:hypothetical protein [Ignavibacteria bacterium]